MAGLVKETVNELGDKIIYKKVVTKTKEGADIYKKMIRQHKHLVPVPCIIINGEIVFKTIPEKEELKNFLNIMIYKIKDKDSCKKSMSMSC